jgi:hypothetical protein
MNQNARQSLLLALLLLLAPAGIAPAADLPASLPQGDDLLRNAAGFVQLDLLAQKQVFLSESGIELMRVYSSSLDPFYRTVLYDRYARNPWGAATLNLLTGGLGSLFMKDTLAGVILETGMTLSYVGYVVSLSSPRARASGVGTWSAIGAAVFGAAGLIWPFLSARPWNEKLKRSLGL